MTTLANHAWLLLPLGCLVLAFLVYGAWMWSRGYDTAKATYQQKASRVVTRQAIEGTD